MDRQESYEACTAMVSDFETLLDETRDLLLKDAHRSHHPALRSVIASLENAINELMSLKS